MKIESALRKADVPNEAGAHERAWALAGDAFAQREPVPARQRVDPRLVALVAAACVAALAVAVTPPGDAVARWVKRIVTDTPGRKDARPGLSSLPSGGRLLVTSPAGAWVVSADGSQRRLGAWSGAAWSPRGRFVVAWRGGRLAAIDPKGVVHWVLTRRAPVRAAAWSPDGFRIAYLSGETVRVVAGDGTGDRLLARHVAAAPPAWSPATVHRLAIADQAGRIRVVDADSGRSAWRANAGEPVIQLAWSPDGRRLVALAAASSRVYSVRGELLQRATTPPGMRNVALAFAPVRRNPALVRFNAGTGRSEVVTFRANGGPFHARRLFAGPGAVSDIAFSPSGSWLLVGWRAAGQWLFLHPDDQRVLAVSHVAAQFAPSRRRPTGFPRVSGWSR